MSLSIYNITFIPTPGSYGTLVQYKKSIDSSWTTPTNPGNPTTMSSYQLILEQGFTYYVRVTSIGLTCTSAPRILTIVVPVVDVCCPPTYSLSVDGTFCFKEETTVATPPSSSQNTVAAQHVAYSTCGSYIYDPGWAINGTGPSTQINPGNSFWINGGSCINNSTTIGPLNRTGLWATTQLSDQDVGFSVCIDITETKTYYVGVGADNWAIIRVNGTTILTQDADALATQYGMTTEVTHRIWHIYPVTLQAGSNIIEIVGHNTFDVASIGAEIYDLTPSQIELATSYGDIGGGLVFSTKDYIGQPIQLGTDGLGWTCPDGYSLSTCEGYICKRILTTATIAC